MVDVLLKEVFHTILFSFILIPIHHLAVHISGVMTGLRVGMELQNILVCFDV